MLKIGFIGKRNCLKEYNDEVVKALGSAELKVEFDQLDNPSKMARRLFYWAENDFDAIVVIDEGITDKSEMFNSIRYFMAKKKEEFKTRVIFVASEERFSNDEDVCALAFDGVYDLVLPFKGDKPVSRAIELIQNPATVENVRFVIGNEAKPFNVAEFEAAHSDLVAKVNPEQKAKEEDTSDRVVSEKEVSKQEDKSTPEMRAAAYMRTEEQPVRVTAPVPGQSVIAVTSLGYRGGASTLSFHIGATIAQVLYRYSKQKSQYHSVAVVTGQKTFDALKGVYGKRFEVVDDRCARFFGYDVYVGYTSGVAGRNYSHVILDCGWIPKKKTAMLPEHVEMQQILEYRSQLSVMAVPMGSVEDIRQFVSLTKDNEDSSLKRMSYVLWGASDELAQQAKDAVRKHWPQAWIESIGWVARPEIPSKEIDSQIVDLVEPYLDIECVKAYKSALKRKAQQSNSADGESEVGEGSTSAEDSLEEKKRKFSFGSLFSKEK